MTAPDALGAYQVMSRLGAGGMGVVWLAKDTRTDRAVVIKSIAGDGLAEAERADLRGRLRREAKVLTALDHDGIVRGLDILEGDGELSLVLEYVEGPTLDAWLRAEAKPELTRRLIVLRRIAAALAYAHDQGVIHRDLKPANVVVAAGDQPKILDFGLAKALDSTKLTQTGMVMGTIAYMAPEQGRGMKADQRADIFAVGMMLAEAFELSAPFGKGDAMSQYRSLVSSTPIEIDDWLPDDVRSILACMLEKTPELRMAEIGEIAATLDGWLAETGFAERIERARVSPLQGRQRAPRLPRLDRPEVATAVERLLSTLGAGRGGGLQILAPSGGGRSWALTEVSERARVAGIETLVLSGVENGLAGMTACSLLSMLVGPAAAEDATVATAPGPSSDDLASRLHDALDGRLAAGQSLALAFDDLQFLSAPELAFLDATLRTARDRPLLVLMAGDASPDGAPTSLRESYGEFLARTAGRDEIVRVQLEAFPVNDVATAIASQGLPEAVATDIARLAGGWPGAAQQLMARWFENGPIAAVVADGPSDLLRRLRARWEHLERGSQSTIRALVESGGELDLPRLVEIAKLPRLAIAARLRELEKKHGWLKQHGERIALTQPFLGAIEIAKANEPEP